MIHADHGGAAGFTLVEVLVALVLAGLLTVILIDGATTARRREAQARARHQAIFLARFLLTEAGAANHDSGMRTGETNHLLWSVSEQPVMVDPRKQVVLVGIVARVLDVHGVLLAELETRRLRQVRAR